MTAYNVVRFRVMPGKDRAFLEAHGPGKVSWPGLRLGSIVKIGEGDYCLIGEWPDQATLQAAMPQMRATLDTFRGVLQTTQSGVTEAFSGEAILTIA
jgi:hypothetical protein